MRRRLDELLSESFEYQTPSPVLSPEVLELEADPGTTLSGYLTISHPAKKRLRGFVFSSNPRMHTEQTDFYNTSAKIRYSIDLTALPEGAVTEGVFTFCTDLGEARVPCRVQVRKKAQKRNAIRVRDIGKLAKEDLGAAAELFVSPSFAEAIQEEDCQIRSLYDALKREKVPAHALEEFLLGSGQKEQIELTLSGTQRILTDPSGTVMEEVTVTCSTWGYLELDISSDARFLRVEKHRVTTEAFAGGVWSLRYIVDANFLHAGRNFGRITVRTCFQTLEYEVMVEKRGSADLRQHRVQSLMVRRAFALYMDYRLGRIDIQKWTGHAQSVLASYRRAGGDSVRADLFGVFLLQAEGKRSSSERELRRIERSGALEGDVEAEAAWLYLSTFFTRDTDYINQVRSRIRTLCLQQRSSWLIRWIALYLLEDEAGGDAGKLEVILRMLDAGCASPILCLEGAQIAAGNPFLLHEWTAGARMLVDFAVREGFAGERLLLHMTSLIRRKGGFDSATFRLLGKCWEASRLDDVLESWVRMAIAGEKTEEKYFPLYQTAVARDLRVTGLYEYYLETMGEVRIEKMPEIIRRFFAMNDRLDWRRKAQAYRNLCEDSEHLAQIYAVMRPAIEKFVLDQLQMTRINEDLAVLYERFLTQQILTPSLAKKLVRMLFTFEVDCLSPVLEKAVVSDIRQNREREAEIRERSARVQIYSEESRILLEDKDGNRYASSSLYMARHLLDSTRLMGLCMKMVPDDPHLTLFFTLNPTRKQPITHKTLEFYRSAEALSGLSEEYRTQVRTWLLDYYTDHPEEDTVEAFLRRIDRNVYAGLDRRRLLGLLTQEGMYEEAYAELERGGCEGVNLAHLLRICSQMVLIREFEEDKDLLDYCAFCFQAGKVEEHILSYLLLYYEGPSARMKALWNVGREYGLETINLEKRILSMILFTREGSGGSEAIYQSYRRSMGNRRLCRAYVILRCYEYLVKEMPVSDILFGDIEESFRKEEKLPDVCALALLQHLSTVPERTAEQDAVAEKLLLQYGNRGIRFAFFQKFPLRLRASLGLEDKVLCECVADPAGSVKLFYRMRGANVPFREEAMRDVFEGIRVKEFVLFEGEELECFTEETAPDGTKTTSGHRFLKAARIPEELKDSRFALISRMSEMKQRGDDEALAEELIRFRQLDSLTRELFTLI